MVVKYDIGSNEIVLHLREGKYITGFTTVGGYDKDLGQVKVNREILPAYFFDNFSSERYLYYAKPEEVIEDKDYISSDNTEGNEESGTIPPKEDMVSREEYDKLKAEMDEMRKMLEQLMKQKG